MAEANNDASLHWGWNPLRWWNRINPLRLFTQTYPLILNLPLEVRVLIWRNLSTRDRKSLTRVCKLFEFDVNQIVGVDAVLYGKGNGSKASSEPSSQLSLLSRTRAMLFGNAARTKQSTPLEDNVNWIRNVLVRSLHLRQFSAVTCDTSALVKKPILLHSLSIELDQHQQAATLKRVNEMLEEYNHLSRLSLEFSTLDYQEKDFSSYNPFVITVTENLFNSLEFKHNLTELSISIKYLGVNFFLDFSRKTYRRIGTLPEIPPVLDAWLQNPVKLKKIDIELPTLPIDHLRRWKKFIDEQDRLTHLKLNFGSVHWNTFSTVLEKCAGSLEVIDLTFINWYEGNVVPEEDLDFEGAEVTEFPEDQWFNWSAVVAQSNSKLKYLRISNSCFGMSTLNYQRQIESMNFCRLTVLNNLEDLVLVGIYLSEVQLKILFKDIKSLKKIELTRWTKTGEVTVFVALPEGVDEEDWEFEIEDYTERNQNLCNLLSQALRLSRLHYVKLIDQSLSYCSEQLRQTILKQPPESVYSVTWPVGEMNWDWGWRLCSLTIEHD